MNNDPHSWTDWWVMVKSWINGDIPLDSLLMTAVIATLRVLYTGTAGHPQTRITRRHILTA